MNDRESIIQALWENSSHGTDRASVEAAFNAGMAAAVPDGLLNKLVDVLDDATDLGPWTAGWASVELIQLREHFTAMLSAVKEVK